MIELRVCFQLHYLHSSPNIIREIISRKVRRMGMWHAWRREITQSLVGKPEEYGHLRRLGTSETDTTNTDLKEGG
jgi:hypothetical protein